MSLGAKAFLLGLYRLVTGCRGCLLVCRGALEFIVQSYRVLYGYRLMIRH